MAGALARVFERDPGWPLVPALVAVLVYLGVLSLAAMLVLNAAAESWRDEAAGRLRVQLPAALNGALQAGAAREDVLGAIRAVPGVERAERLSPDRLVETLRPLIGEAFVPPDALPVVIEVVIAGQPADAGDEAAGRVPAVIDRLRALVPAATVDRAADALSPALLVMRTVAGLALLVVVLLANTLTTAVVLATRQRMAALRETLEVLHLLGAADQAITNALTGRALLAAGYGGLAGFVPALVTLLALARLTEASGGAAAASSLPPAALALALVPAGAAALAALATRIAARQCLAALP